MVRLPEASQIIYLPSRASNRRGCSWGGLAAAIAIAVSLPPAAAEQPTPTPTPDLTYGYIDVYSTPVPGAEIYLDFVFPTGQQTNATIGPVSSGTHNVYVVPPAGTPAPMAQEVTVSSDSVALAEFDTSTGTGSITVSSSPVTDGGKIYLDYHDTGLTTAGGGTTLNTVAAGTHYVMVRKETAEANDCVKPGSYPVLVETGQATSAVSDLYLSSATASATIAVDSATSGAYILLDYIDLIGMTPATVSADIGYGTHAVTVRKTGYLIPPPQNVELSASTPATSIRFDLIPGTPWPMFRHNELRTGQSPYLGSRAPALRWSYLTGGNVSSSPSATATDTVHVGSVYLGSDDGRFYSLYSDGSIAWSYQTAGDVNSSPAVDIDGSIYVGSGDSRLYGLSPSGSLIWSYTTNGALESSPALSVTGSIYAGSSGNRLYSFGRDGSLSWSYETANDIVSSAALGLDGSIYVGSLDARIYCLEPDGSFSWSYSAGAGIESSPSVTATSAAHIGSLYVGSLDGRLSNINSDGSLSWSYETNDAISSSPALSATGAVYIGSFDNLLYCIDPDGSLSWSYETGDNVASSPALGLDGTVYFGSDDTRLYSLAPDGSFSWSFATGGPVYSSPSIGADGTIYTGSDDYSLYAIYGVTATPTPTVTPTSTPSPSAGDVVINEIAWMGTTASSIDEWIELYNTTSSPIDIASWSIYGADTGVTINFSDADGSTTTVVPAHGFLLYADKQSVFSSGATVQIWDSTIGMNNTNPGQVILYSAPNGGGTAIDTANQATGDWFAGDSSSRTTMERIDPNAAGDVAGNWADFSGTPFAKDSGGNDINGTPGKQNSVAVGTPTPTPTGPTPTPTSTSLPTATPTATPIPGFYVSVTTGSDTTGDGSRSAPWKTIGHALASVSATASHPVALYVAAGTYPEYELDMKEYVSIFGGYEPTTWVRDVDTYQTIVDGSGGASDDDIFDGADNAALDGLTIQNAPRNGVMALFSSPTITNCRFYNCHGDGAVVVERSCTIRRCVFSGNEWHIFGYANPGYNVIVENCLLTSSGDDAIFNKGTNMRIINNTLANNNGDGFDIWLDSGTASPTLLFQNNIITQNGDDGIDLDSYHGDPVDLNLVTIQYNDVWSNGSANYRGASPGEGDISADPFFINPIPQTSVSSDTSRVASEEDEERRENEGETGERAPAPTPSPGAKREAAAATYDYHLQDISPCINRGTNVDAPADDLDGNPRPVNGVTDIGCYEYQGVVPTPTPGVPPVHIILENDTFSPGDIFNVYIQFWDTIMDWDGYLVITGNGGIWSIRGGRLVRGIQPIVSNALEMHQFYSALAFSMVVPFGIPGDYKIWAAIIPAGWAATLENAHGPYGQLDVREFTITE